MPQFIMEGILEPDFQALDDFTQGYIQALFFTNQSCIPMAEFHTEESQHLIREGQADGELPNDAGFIDLHPDALAQIIADCETFQTEFTALIEAACEGEYDAERAGMDFWFTRNGHGVGFWDRDLGQVGDDLTEATKGFGEVNPYFSDEPDDSSPSEYGFVYLF